MEKRITKIVVGIIFDKRGDPPYISVNKLWNETVSIIKEKFEVEIFEVDSYNVESNSEYREFVNKIDVLVLLSPYYTIDRTVKDFPVIFYGLGSMQKGGHWLVDNNDSFKSYDETILNCTACMDIFDNLVENDSIGHELIPFGVDTSIFYPIADKKQLRKKYNVPEDAFLMVYCGRINLQKNPTLLLSILRDLKCKYDNIMIMFIGSYDEFYISEFNNGEVPDIKMEFQKLIDEFEISDRIIFFETQNDARTYAEMINMADIGINMTTLISENFGYTPVEMQSCGLPVVGTDWGGLKDTIIDGVTGFKIETIHSHFGARINIEQAKDRIEYLINHPDKLVEMEKNARENVEKNFSKRNFAEKVQDLIVKTHNNFLNNKKDVEVEVNPIMINMSENISELYGTGRHVSWEHLHPEIDLKHYDLIASYCATCNAEEKVWKEDSNISKGFDWIISNNHFVSYDPRWNKKFELKNCNLDENEIHILKLINDGYSLKSIVNIPDMNEKTVMHYLKKLTVKGMILPWEKSSNDKKSC